MQIKFANIFLNKLGAAEASSVIGCLDRLLEMQQQRVNTPPVLFDGAVSLKDLCYDGNVVGWLAHEINRLFQPESAPGRRISQLRFMNREGLSRPVAGGCHEQVLKMGTRSPKPTSHEP